jgi:hypothetical protein
MKITERERLRRRVLIEYAKRDYLENVYGTYNERTLQASYKWYNLYRAYKRRYNDTPLNKDY